MTLFHLSSTKPPVKEKNDLPSGHLFQKKERQAVGHKVTPILIQLQEPSGHRGRDHEAVGHRNLEIDRIRPLPVVLNRLVLGVEDQHVPHRTRHPYEDPKLGAWGVRRGFQLSGLEGKGARCVT